jgi:hypothetical protein
VNIHIPDAEGEIEASKGIFVGLDPQGKQFVSTANIQTRDLIAFTVQLVEYSMIRIAAEQLLRDPTINNKPLTWDEIMNRF